MQSLFASAPSFSSMAQFHLERLSTLLNEAAIARPRTPFDVLPWMDGRGSDICGSLYHGDISAVGFVDGASDRQRTE
ncbi:hypothetical protein V6N13_106844 [Hibiscus sabdariffa]